VLLTPAVEADYPAIVTLANLAYRGTGGNTGSGSGTASWNVETGIIEGTRLTESLLREEVAAKADGFLLTVKDEQAETLLGTVRLDPKPDALWHLSLLAVRPDMQAKQLGRAILEAAECFAKERGARRIRMTVLHVRDRLIAWYVRRGYHLTGESEPFPYGDERFGRPLRNDLHFVVLEKDIEKR
jgi:ribosomal protein S18 acetylase RimI-like enzyme